ncbi:hypothetical protein KSX_00040 [Ktedonospora formicarum]|uniref:Uncharacterized protein n=1 Tax=Ktedonospora formicarum TaxID=2778364 RepID=A0A8J3HR82_9CHLR|nr:hypothetical protein KSX_00040 [Ktedonospora formicarum]
MFFIIEKNMPIIGVGMDHMCIIGDESKGGGRCSAPRYGRSENLLCELALDAGLEPSR